MEFEWDEAKRLTNATKHGADFEDGVALFDGRPTLTKLTNRYGEERWLTIGLLDDVFIAVAWTKRGNAVRFISMRRASDEERRGYRKVHG